jgi:DNA polymerase-3 subunit gamma/tau
LSLLEQGLSCGGGNVTAKDVQSVLGIMDEDFLFAMADKLMGGDAKGVLTSLDQVVRQGRDMAVFAGELAGHMRALLLAKACGDCADLLSCTADRMARYEKQAAKHANARILYAMEKLMGVQNDMRYFPSPRMLLETVLVRIAQPVDDDSMEALGARLALVEKQLKELQQNGVPAPAAAPTPKAPVYAPAPPEDAPPWEEYLPEPPPEEGYLPPEAYESEPAPEPTPKPASQPQPASKPEPQPKPTLPSDPAPQPAARPAAAEQAAAADALWKQVLSRVQRANALVHLSAAYGQATELTEEQLTVSFPAQYAGKLKMLNARSVAVIQGELDALRPGVRLLLRESDAGSDVADLVGLFKDKLTIT